MNSHNYSEVESGKPLSKSDRRGAGEIERESVYSEFWLTKTRTTGFLSE